MSTANPQLLSINPNVLFSNGFLNYSRKKGASYEWLKKYDFCCNHKQQDPLPRLQEIRRK
jgi:hypothetical protein